MKKCVCVGEGGGEGCVAMQKGGTTRFRVVLCGSLVSKF